MIRYLGQEEYGKCLPLWQEAFPEDSQAFLGYYFNKKLPGSRVLVKEDGSGSILTMAHLNPYTVMVRRRRYRLSYIVGVATAASSCPHPRISTGRLGLPMCLTSRYGSWEMTVRPGRRWNCAWMVPRRSGCLNG